MAFKKVINRLSIQPQYKTFTDEFLKKISMLFSGNLHSVYMCGSIPKGKAVPGQSDGDFTLVFNRQPAESAMGELELLKKKMLIFYPFITKINTPNCLVSEVHSDLYGWGYWIKIICINVYGSDLGLDLPYIEASQDLVRDLNHDTEEVILGLLSDFKKEPSELNGRTLAKRLLQAMYSLTLIKEEVWEDDFQSMLDICSSYFPKWKESLDIIYRMVLKPDFRENNFLIHVEKLFCFILVQSSISITNIKHNDEHTKLVAKWTYDEFIHGKYPDLNLEKFIEIVRNRKTTELPMTFIVKAGSNHIGTVSLFEHDLNERLHLTPWLGSLFVEKIGEVMV